jgi:hypothetical protein
MKAMALGEIEVNITDENPVLGNIKNTYHEIISRETKTIQQCPRIHG